MGAVARAVTRTEEGEKARSLGANVTTGHTRSGVTNVRLTEQYGQHEGTLQVPLGDLLPRGRQKEVSHCALLICFRASWRGRKSKLTLQRGPSLSVHSKRSIPTAASIFGFGNILAGGHGPRNCGSPLMSMTCGIAGHTTRSTSSRSRRHRSRHRADRLPQPATVPAPFSRGANASCRAPRLAFAERTLRLRHVH